MEKSRKNLKEFSFVILILAALSFLKTVLDVAFFDIDSAGLPEGTTAEILLISRIVMCVIGLIVLIPQIYVGVKGIKISKAPDPDAKAHIVWAIVLIVFSAIALITAVKALFTAGNFTSDLISVADTTLEAAIYTLYIISAKEVRKAA